MRIPSGVTDQYIYFVAVDATDLKTRETGLTTWTVYRSRNGAAAAAMTTPTINETDVTNMPGVYELLLDEDMTIDAGDDSQEMVFHITHAGMAPVTRTIELYRPKITAGNTLDVTATGAAGIDWGNVENQGSTVDLSVTSINLCDTTTSVSNGVTASTVTDKTGYSISGTKTTLDALNDVSTADVNAQADLALSDIGLDHLISAALPTNWATDVAAGSVFDNIADNGTASFDRTTDSLQAIRDAGGGDATAANQTTIINAIGTMTNLGGGADIANNLADIAGATFSTATDSLEAIRNKETDIETDTQDLQTQVGTAGAGLTAVPWNASWDAEVQSECNDALVANGLDHLISAALPTSWAVDVVAGSVFDQLADDGTASYDRTTDSLQAVRDHVGDGTNLTEAGGTGDHLTTLATAASITALNDLAAADVLTQVNAALDTAIAELGVAAPTATPTLRTGLMLLYMALRNKTVVQTSGTDALEIYNDAGTKICSKLLTDDGSDYTEAEMA